MTGCNDVAVHPSPRSGMKLWWGNGDAGPTPETESGAELDRWRPIRAAALVPEEKIRMEQGVWTLVLVLGVAGSSCFL